MNTTDVKTLQGAVRLADWGVMRAQGADAASFLHGQLTQDVLQLDDRSARLAGFCSAKGRLQASLLIWRASSDELLLACSADVLAATLKRLSMFVLRAKCKLSDASASLDLYGLRGTGGQRLARRGVPQRRHGSAAMPPVATRCDCPMCRASRATCWRCPPAPSRLPCPR